MNKKIIFSSGGTGGHIFPAINLMNYLSEKGYEAVLVTDKRGSKFLENHSKSIDSLILNEKQWGVFKDSIYIKTNISMFGDEIFFLSTDSLIIKCSAAMEYLINHPDSTDIP